jgi:hypothetical protein
VRAAIDASAVWKWEMGKKHWNGNNSITIMPLSNCICMLVMALCALFAAVCAPLEGKAPF